MAVHGIIRGFVNEISVSAFVRCSAKDTRIVEKVITIDRWRIESERKRIILYSGLSKAVEEIRRTRVLFDLLFTASSRRTIG